MFIEIELEELTRVGSSHFPDRSAKWLLRQREHFEALLRLVAGDLLEYLDLDRVKQLNRSFISDELRTQESDMVFSVPFRLPGEPPQELIVYILIEHQSTVDRAMGLRLLSYMVQIWMEERRVWIEEKRPESERGLTPIVPIVFYTGTGEWKTPISLMSLLDIPEVLTRFVPTFDTLLLDVKATDPETLTQTATPFGWLLRVLQQEHSDEPSMRQALLEALAALNDLQATDTEQYTRAILYLFLLILHRRAAKEHQDLLDILVEENIQNQEIVNMAASIIELSEQRGLQQGIEQGARQMSIESTLLILTERFPNDDVPTVQPLLEAITDLDRLRQLSLNASIASSFRAFREQLEA